MTYDPDHWVVVASGSQEQVHEWSRILRAARVGFDVIKPCEADCLRSDYAELWVACDECEEARETLRRKDGKTRLW